MHTINEEYVSTIGLRRVFNSLEELILEKNRTAIYKNSHIDNYVSGKGPEF
jgi:hypothetical protein